MRVNVHTFCQHIVDSREGSLDKPMHNRSDAHYACWFCISMACSPSIPSQRCMSCRRLFLLMPMERHCIDGLVDARPTIIEYPAPIPLENQVGWPLCKNNFFILLLFFLILHYWQYRLNIGFSRGCFLDVINIARRSGFWFSSVFSGSLLESPEPSSYFFRCFAGLWFSRRCVAVFLRNDAFSSKNVPSKKSHALRIFL